MIKYLPLVAYVLISSTAHAGTCEQFEDLATSVMKHRQYGTPMSNLMAIEEMGSFKSLIIAAYETPRFSSEDYQERAIRDFADSVYLECVKVESND